MKHAPIVSVLMTAYNREEYIAEAIESVLNSSFKDFELIIVDDCSTDNTLSIAKAFETRDDRIKVYLNEKNLGDYNNRNKAASYAQGKYLKYLDADDLIYSHGLEVMINSIEKFPDAAFGTQSNLREDLVPYPILLDSKSSYYEHYFKGGVFLSGPTGVIINREKFLSVGGFSGKRYIGDTELWLMLAAKHKIVKFQPSLIWWRTHNDQEINKERQSFDPVLKRYELDKRMICSDASPLNTKQKKQAFKQLNRRFILNTLFFLFFRSNRIKTLTNFIEARLGFFNILQAIFN